MRKIKAISLVYAILFLICSPCFSHGIEAASGQGGIYVKASYDGTAAVSFADVSVFTPGGEEFLAGTTDINGIFAFVPDSRGKWKVEIDDGMGHRIVKTLEIDKKNQLAEKGQKKGFSRLYGIITGIGLIFGIWGLFMMFRAKAEK